MQTIATFQVPLPNVSACETVDRIRALGHRMEVYTARLYEFPESIRAIARGTSKPICAWAETCAKKECVGTPHEIRVVQRRTIPVPYLDWNAAEVTGDTLTEEVLITHKIKLLIKEGKHVCVEMVMGSDVDVHLEALNALCAASGFGPVDVEVSRCLRSLHGATRLT